MGDRSRADYEAPVYCITEGIHDTPLVIMSTIQGSFDWIKDRYPYTGDILEACITIHELFNGDEIGVYTPIEIYSMIMGGDY